MNGKPTQQASDKLAALKKEREQSWDAHWKDISAFLAPRRGRFPGDKPNDGTRRGGKILDSVGTQSLHMLAAGMHGGLTPLSRPWFKLGASDQTLQNVSGVRQWLADAERSILHALAKSNFYESAHSFYIELAAFGTAVMLVLDNFPDGLRFFVPTAGEYYLSTDHAGRVDTFYRAFQMTARQMEQQFGKASLSSSAQSVLERSPYDWLKVVHCVEPNRSRDPQKADGPNKPYASLYFQEGEEDFLSKGGFEERPFISSRWDVVGHDAYGRSPGMDVLSDVKMLQAMSETQLQAVHTMVAPPMRAPTSLRATLNLLPGAVNFVDGQSNDAVTPLYQVTPNLRDMEAKLEQTRANIRSGFFNDLFMTLRDHPDMTATEVAERHEEKLLLLGPVIERTQSEALDPLIERAFYVLLRQGGILPAPEALAGQELKVEYVSMLAQAQKAIGTQNIARMTAFVGGLAQLNPDVLDKVNLDVAVDEYAEAQGVPPRLVRTDEEVAQIRQARAQAQQDAQSAAQERADSMAIASQIKDLGSIPSEGNMAAEVAQAGMQ